MSSLDTNLFKNFQTSSLDKPKSVNADLTSPKTSLATSDPIELKKAEKSKIAAYAVAGGSVISAGVLGIWAVKNGRGLKAANKFIGELDKVVASGKDEISKLGGKLYENAQEIGKLGEKLNESAQEISSLGVKLAANSQEIANISKEKRALQGIIDELSVLPENATKIKSQYSAKYEKIISDTTLSYDPMVAPLEKSGVKPLCGKIFNLENISQVTPPGRVISTTDVEGAKAILRDTGRLEYIIPSQTYQKIQPNPQDFIEGKQIADLGKVVDTDLTLAYGKRINWSEEKIARDIMQNFYDGHGNTLEGVKFLAEKTSNGGYRIRITGDATFDHKCLRFIGSGDKGDNLYNAGGFGEGSRVVVANLLGREDTSAVKFASADWEMLFDGANGIMRRAVSKAAKPLDGNYIEFETKNEKLVNSLVDSMNYFRHPSNPDFHNLSFENAAFGFRFLEKGKKGNIYLAQRYEFGQNNQWYDGVDNLNIIFKQKPDPVKYEKITGKKFSLGRDRTYLNCDDIVGLTRYFAREMSDKEISESIMLTKPMWGQIKTNSEKTALKSFLEGLISEAELRGIKIDLKGEKFVAFDYVTNETVVNMLTSYGYKFLPEKFSNIGIPNATSMFRQLSVHNPVAPTVAQIKKLKLLEEGVEIVQQQMSKSFYDNLGKFKIGESDILADKLNSYYTLSELRNLVPDKINVPIYTGLKDLNSEDFAKLSKSLIEHINTRAKEIALNPDAKEADSFVGLLNFLLKNNSLAPSVQEKVKFLDNLKLIKPEDVRKPRLIFDRNSELATNTLGEAIIDGNRRYLGHWVDKEYLDSTTYNEALATWLHEICHKSGGDGSDEFTYALTDLIKGLLSTTGSSSQRIALNALEEIYNKL